MSFDFGQIADTIADYMDSDYIDIKRDVNGILTEVYSNVRCHLAFSSVDNPDPNSADIKPIIQSLNIHAPVWVDLKNNDYIVAKRMDDLGKILAVYSGRCGNPVMSMGRQKVSVAMQGTEPEKPTPVPPLNPLYISIECTDGTDILKEYTLQAEKNNYFYLASPAIEGFSIKECYIDDVLQAGTNVVIDSVTKNVSVKFVYEAVEIATGLRILINSLYSKDDGTLTSGYHLYKEIAIDSISESSGEYSIISEPFSEIHEDSGKKLALADDVKIALMPAKIFCSIQDFKALDNGSVSLNAVPFTPTEAEENAYVTHWYQS